ncbi:MAG: fibrobacter succinogenes major paralogous domain-containing protein [Bacteroidales bacterium]|nr:fibrobacter succinogenes major paralogous domain-containing protein [Bacteroidales bacterium]
MRKLFILGVALTISVAMLMTSCKKEEVNNDNNQDHVLPNAVIDIDGNHYDAVQIGDQIWMAENLRTTKYADGTKIPMGSTSHTEPYRYAPGDGYSNEENMGYVARYGYLYNWPAVMHGASSSGANPSGVQGICPNGWHVPSDAEWTQLTDYMKTQTIYMASSNADHLAKALAATWGWYSSSETDAPGNNPSTNNASGFSALPAGLYDRSDSRCFGSQTFFWCATESSDGSAYVRWLLNDIANVERFSQRKDLGFSVRCVRD